MKYSTYYEKKDGGEGPEIYLSDGAFSDSKTLGKALRDMRALEGGTRVSRFEVIEDKVRVYPSHKAYVLILTKV